MFSLQQFLRFKSIDQYFTKTIKNRSRRILRLWTDHCEYIIAQRVRRSQQMICLYRRIWDEQALRWIVQQLRKQVKHSAVWQHTSQAFPVRECVSPIYVMCST